MLFMGHVWGKLDALSDGAAGKMAGVGMQLDGSVSIEY